METHADTEDDMIDYKDLDKTAGFSKPAASPAG